MLMGGWKQALLRKQRLNSAETINALKMKGNMTLSPLHQNNFIFRATKN